MRLKIVVLIGTGFRRARDTALDIANPKTGGTIKFVRSAITTKVVVFANATETGGKGVGQLTGGLAMNLRNQKVASHSKVLTVERFE